MSNYNRYVCSFRTSSECHRDLVDEDALSDSPTAAVIVLMRRGVFDSIVYKSCCYNCFEEMGYYMQKGEDRHGAIIGAFTLLYDEKYEEYTEDCALLPQYLDNNGWYYAHETLVRRLNAS